MLIRTRLIEPEWARILKRSCGLKAEAFASPMKKGENFIRYKSFVFQK